MCQRLQSREQEYPLRVRQEQPLDVNIYDTILGSSFVRTGVPGDGSCLIHSILFLTMYTYRENLKNGNDSANFELVREKRLALSESPIIHQHYPTPAKIDNIRNPKISLDLLFSRVYMCIEKLNIIFINGNNGDLACGQSAIDDPLENDACIADAILKNPDWPFVFVYFIGTHFEPLSMIHRDSTTRQRVFYRDDPCVCNVIRRYTLVCNNSGPVIDSAHPLINLPRRCPQPRAPWIYVHELMTCYGNDRTSLLNKIREYRSKLYYEDNDVLFLQLLSLKDILIYLQNSTETGR